MIIFECLDCDVKIADANEADAHEQEFGHAVLQTPVSE